LQHQAEATHQGASKSLNATSVACDGGQRHRSRVRQHHRQHQMTETPYCGMHVDDIWPAILFNTVTGSLTCAGCRLNWTSLLLQAKNQYAQALKLEADAKGRGGGGGGGGGIDSASTSVASTMSDGDFKPLTQSLKQGDEEWRNTALNAKFWCNIGIHDDDMLACMCASTITCVGTTFLWNTRARTHTREHLRTHLREHLHPYTATHLHTSTHIHTHIRTHTDTHTSHIRTLIITHSHAHTRTHTHARAHTRTHTHTNSTGT